MATVKIPNCINYRESKSTSEMCLTCGACVGSIISKTETDHSFSKPHYYCNLHMMEVYATAICDKFRPKRTVMEPKHMNCDDWKNRNHYTRTGHTCEVCINALTLATGLGLQSVCKKLLLACKNLDEGRISLDGHCDLWERK